jgi:flagellar hook-associated protein 3 FlgL
MPAAPPAPPVFSAAPPTGTRQAEISSGLLVPLNHNGTELLLDTGTLQALHDLSTALGANDGTAITAALSGLDAAHGSIQTLLGDVGARTQQLEVTTANIDALDRQMQALRSQLEEADIEATVTELVSRQTAYQAAMLATSRVMGLNLADYLG